MYLPSCEAEVFGLEREWEVVRCEGRGKERGEFSKEGKLIRSRKIRFKNGLIVW